MSIQVILSFSQYSWAQQGKSKKMPPARHYKVTPVPADLPGIKIDGVLAEDAWQGAVVIPLPYEFSPGNNLPAHVKTECLITFSRSKLYIGFRCYDPQPGKIRAHLMDRDAGYNTFTQDDHVAFYIDSFNDERRAYYFMVNPLGVQVDGIFNQLDSTVNFTWDGIWESAGKITGSGYVLELAIPFNQLRFPNTKGKQTWGFSIERSYPRTMQYRFMSHPWSRDASTILPFINKISGFENMEAGKELEFDPTLTLNRTDRREDIQDEMVNGKLKVEPGLSARWGITPNLTLQSTINPDFSQVEADVAQLEVNTRFALYYPEKRPFFLDGLDYFSLPMEMVYTRTVYDPTWGIKMIGKTGKNTIGFFLDQDRSNNLLFPANQGSRSTTLDENVLGGVFRYRRDIGKRANLGVLYTGRKSDEYYNHVASVDGVFWLSSRKKLVLQYTRTQTRYPEQVAKNYNQPASAFGGNSFYLYFINLSRKFWYAVEYENVATDFRADFGFIPRADYRKYRTFLQYIFYGKPKGWFDRIFLYFDGAYIVNQAGELSERNLILDVTYLGPLQTTIAPAFISQKLEYLGVTYDLNKFQAYFEMKPTSGVKYYIFSKTGDAVDYTNARPARSFLFNPGLELSLGRHFYLNLDHNYERLSYEGKRVYTANLFQARTVYNFNLKTFFRAIVQYVDIDRDINLYIVPVLPTTRTLFTQLLFSYKINPRTVLFLGYSDNHLGMKGIDLIRKDRTFFLKIGYALVL
jgi:hypothetical protein